MKPLNGRRLIKAELQARNNWLTECSLNRHARRAEKTVYRREAKVRVKALIRALIAHKEHHR